MKYQFIYKTDKPVMCYRVMVKTGDVVDFDAHFSRKAERNPDWIRYEPINQEPEGTVSLTKKKRKKRGD